MKQEMLINVAQAEECRIAIVEDSLLEELYLERTSQHNYVGNIYKGRIVNLEPSIQAAFVDFGVGRNGFLHISDVEAQYFRQGGYDPYKPILPNGRQAREEESSSEGDESRGRGGRSRGGGGTRTLDLCREIRRHHPDLTIVAGGGVRGLDDLKTLADAGCDAALVASALHDGRLTRQDIERAAAFGARR